MVLYYFCYCIK